MRSIIVIYLPYNSKPLDIEKLKLNHSSFEFLIIEDVSIRKIRVEVFFKPE